MERVTELIEGVEIQGSNVSIAMVLTSGWCPFAARLLEMIKGEVGKLPEVDAVDVDVVWDPTWTPERMSAGAREKLRLPLGALRRAARREPRPDGLLGHGQSS